MHVNPHLHPHGYVYAGGSSIAVASSSAVSNVRIVGVAGGVLRNVGVPALPGRVDTDA